MSMMNREMYGYKVDMSELKIAIIYHLYLSGMRLGVDLRMGTE